MSIQIPKEFPTFRNLADVDLLFEALCHNLPMDDTNCYTSTLFQAVNVTPTLLMEVNNKLLSKEARLAAISNWVQEYLKYAAARKEALVLLNLPFLDAARNEILKDAYSDITAKVKLDVKVGVTPQADVDLYGEKSRQFRAAISSFLYTDNFDSNKAPLCKSVKLTKNIAFKTMDMLKSIKSKSKAVLNFQKEPDLAYEAVFLPVKQQKASRHGEVSPRDLNGSREFCQRFETLSASKEDTHSQYANLDIVFNFYLHLRASGIIAPGTTEDYHALLKELNATLHFIGQELFEKERIQEILRNAGAPISNLIGIFNNTGATCIPPYCLTAKRMYDMVAVFGILKIDDLRRSFVDSGISPRAVEHFKPDSTAVTVFITTYWCLLDSLNDYLSLQGGSAETNGAECMFHQLNLAKKSAYTNTTDKISNEPNFSVHPQFIDSQAEPVQHSIESLLNLIGFSTSKVDIKTKE